MPDHSRSAALLRLFGDGWASFFVADSLVQDQPDQPTLSMSYRPDHFVVSQAWYRSHSEHFHRPASTGESSNGTISAGACPGDDESAGVNYSHRSPKGNRHMRRVLNQAANAAARTKGSIFEIVYRRS